MITSSEVRGFAAFVSDIIVNLISFGFGLLMGQSKTFEDILDISHYFLKFSRPTDLMF